MLKTRVNELLGIKHPVLQGAMAWISGWEMTVAVSKAGGLGTIASATMEPEKLIEHISKVRGETGNPFAVNIPLRLPSSKKAAQIAMSEEVPVVVSSAGDPGIYTEGFKRKGIKALQVVFTLDMVKRCREVGVDGIIAMGMEGGGNINPAELSTFVLVREAVEETDLPVIAAGGIADAQGLVAALALGAEGVQMGTRFWRPRKGRSMTGTRRRLSVQKIQTPWSLEGQQAFNSGSLKTDLRERYFGWRGRDEQGTR